MGLIDDIKRKVFQGEEIYSSPGTVKEVNDSTRTATIEALEGPEIYEVRLQATSGNEKGLYIKPAVGSFVLVTWLSPEDAFISMIDEIDEIKIETNDAVELSPGGDATISAGGKVTVENGDASLKELVSDLLDLLESKYILTTPSGPTGAPIGTALSEIQAIKSKANKLFK